MNYLEQYTKAIENGDIVACEKIKKLYKRLYKESKIKSGRWKFDAKRGERPVFFIETFCKQYKGPLGENIKLELFQKAFIQCLYGFVDKKTNLRRFSEALMVIGRKNGKSTLASGLALYELIADHEGGPEIDTVATKKDQAKIVFDSAVAMLKQSPALSKITKKRKTDVYCEVNMGTIQPLSSDSNTLDGLNPSMAIIDELHAIKDRNIYDVVKQGMTAREQPILLQITTASIDDKPDSIYETQYTYAEKVINGEVKDDRFLPVIYELDSPDEMYEAKKWIKANPGIGTIKRLDVLAEFVERAKTDPAYLPTVQVKDFNIKTTSHSSWLTWQQIKNAETFEFEEVRNTYAIGGCDLSATTDLTCATLLIKKPNEGKIYALQQYFLPEERIKHIEQSSSKEAPYSTWADRGLLTICPGSRVDFHAVTEWFMNMRDKYEITMLWCGYDRALAGYWAEEMASEFGINVMEKIAQGPFTWTAPMKELGARLSDKEINYNNNPMLAWCMSNVAVKVSGTNENIQPVKISSTRRIDGFVSLLNAYTCYLNHKTDFENLIDG